MLGVDSSPSALALGRARAEPGSRFVAARVPTLPFTTTFDVVLLIETMLAFADKRRLVAEVARLLAHGGRFAFTFEEGPPLSAAERALIPGGDTVWLIELVAMREVLERAGLVVRSLTDHTVEHAALLVTCATPSLPTVPRSPPPSGPRTSMPCWRLTRGGRGGWAKLGCASSPWSAQVEPSSRAD